MKHFKILLIVLVIFSISCKKEKISIYAGDINNLFHYDFQPDIIVDNQNNVDSIDLNKDGNADLLFKYQPIPRETGYIKIPIIITKNNFQILISELNNQADTLNFGDPISNNEKWSSKTDSIVLLIDFEKGQFDHYFPYGNWIFAEDKYIGVKHNNRYGWVRITNYYIFERKIIIKEFAFEV